LLFLQTKICCIQICKQTYYVLSQCRTMTGCSGLRYMQADQMCCFGQLLPRIPTGECCGTTVFVPGCEKCNNGIVVSNYNPATQMCCGRIAQDLIYQTNCCCGTTVINTATTVCSNNIPQPRTDNSTCCGMQMFNLIHIILLNEASNMTVPNFKWIQYSKQHDYYHQQA